MTQQPARPTVPPIVPPPRAHAVRAHANQSDTFVAVYHFGGDPVPLTVAELHAVPSPAELRRGRIGAAGGALVLLLLALWVYRRPRPTDGA